jgi:hypothetical protein
MKFDQIELIAFQGDKFNPEKRGFEHINNFIGSIEKIKNKLANLHIMKPIEHIIHDLGNSLDSILSNRNSKVGMERSLDMGKAKMNLLNALDDENNLENNVSNKNTRKNSPKMKMQFNMNG